MAFFCFRAPSERFLLQNTDPRKSYGTCSGSSSNWTHFMDHAVTEGETLAGLSLRYNITIQDIKLCNKIWTNEGLWPGRMLRIPISDVSKPCTLDIEVTNLVTTMSGCGRGRTGPQRQ